MYCACILNTKFFFVRHVLVKNSKHYKLALFIDSYVYGRTYKKMINKSSVFPEN